MVLFRTDELPGVYEIRYVGRVDSLPPGSVVVKITHPASSDAGVSLLIDLALKDAIENAAQ